MSKKAEQPEQSTLPMVQDSYAVLKSDPAELQAVFQANLGAGQLSEFDLDRVKVPAGGGRVWQVPGIDGDQDQKTIEGVIVGWREPRAFWSQGIDVSGGGTPPDCTSPDGVVGHGDPGGECLKCPFAQFGSKASAPGKAARGQACKQMRIVFVVRPDDLLPLVITAPPTSLRPLRQYFLRLASRSVPYHGVVTRFELDQDRNKDGIAYSKIVPSVSSYLADEDRARMRTYADALAPIFSRVRVDPADAAAEAA